MATFRRSYRRGRYQTNVVNFVSQRQWHCGEDSRRELARGRLDQAKSLYRRDLIGHFGCVNAIEFSQGNAEWIVSGGDDRRVLVWNVQEALVGGDNPRIMKGQHNSNIFCLGFNQSNTKIFSGGNDEQVVVHDFKTGATLDVFLHEYVVYGLSMDPNNDNVFASAADDGKVRIYDIRDDQPFCLASCITSMHAVMYNPVEPRLLLTANNDEGVGLWDIRKPKKCLLKYKYGGDLGPRKRHDCMSVRLNSIGTQLIALYRRRPLMLYNIDSPTPVCKFSSSQTEYLNCCTMKSCCFAGDKDQFVMSGSDLFHVFMWEIPHLDMQSDQGSSLQHVHSTHMLLKSHRSIVNQVRYSNVNHLLVSSGVEKVVKIWSPFPLPGGEGDLNDQNSSSRPERVRYSQEESMSIALRHDMMHDYTTGSVEEDPHMMAFFDSLIQAGGDPWSSDEDSSSDFFLSLHSLESRTSDDSEDRSNLSSSGQNETVAADLGELLANRTVQRPQNTLNQSDSSSGSSSPVSWDNFNEISVQRHQVSRARDGDLSDTDSLPEAESGEAAPNQSVDPPYRARAKKAVKKLRQMRARIANSDTSDNDEGDSDKDASVCRGSDGASTSNDKKSSFTTERDESVRKQDSKCDLDLSRKDNKSSPNDVYSSVKKNNDKTYDCGGSVKRDITLSVNNGKKICLDFSNCTTNTKYKTATNGNTNNGMGGQQTISAHTLKVDNSVVKFSGETTLREEVNGNHTCIASTSSAFSADLNTDCSDLTNSGDQPAKTGFKKLKSRNLSRVQRQYRGRRSSDEDE